MESLISKLSMISKLSNLIMVKTYFRSYQNFDLDFSDFDSVNDS